MGFLNLILRGFYAIIGILVLAHMIDMLASIFIKGWKPLMKW